MTAVVIPDAVRATVLRRLARLDRTGRAVLMQASVIGYRFGFDVVVAVVRRPESRVRAALDGACGLQLIVAEGGGGDRFAFRHALTRDIIYAEFANARVRPLHRRIVAALERTAPDESAALEDLAYHAWASADAERGVRYNERAGDRAFAMHADDDARAHFVRARSLVEIGSPAYSRLSEKLAALGPRPGHAR